MAIINYEFTLEADGFDAITLDVSSFSYRATTESRSGNLIIQGFDDSGSIADRIDGTLTLTKIKAGVETEILTGTITTPNEFTGSITETLSLDFEFDFSGSLLGSVLEIDDISSYYALQSGYYSFRVPEIYEYYQPGMVVSLDGIDHFIDEMNTQYQSRGAGYVTLNEGDMIAEAVDSDPENNCTFTITSGVPYSDSMGGIGDDCCIKSAIDPLVGECYGIDYFRGYNFIERNVGGDIYNFMYSRYYQFTLAAESDVSIEVQGLFTDLDNDPVLCNGYGGYDGFQAWLTAGQYSAFETGFDRYSSVFSRFGANEIKTFTLPAGIYTLILINIANEDGGAISFDIDFTAV